MAKKVLCFYMKVVNHTKNTKNWSISWVIDFFTKVKKFNAIQYIYIAEKEYLLQNKKKRTIKVKMWDNRKRESRRATVLWREYNFLIWVVHIYVLVCVCVTLNQKNLLFFHHSLRTFFLAACTLRWEGDKKKVKMKVIQK